MDIKKIYLTRRSFLSTISVLIGGISLSSSCWAFKKKEFSGNVKINQMKCNGCGDCVNVCPAGVLKMKEGKAVVVNNDCFGDSCASCVEVCQPGAIRVWNTG